MPLKKANANPNRSRKTPQKRSKHENNSEKHAIKAQKNARAQQRINTRLELTPPLKFHILLLCPVISQVSSIIESQLKTSY